MKLKSINYRRHTINIHSDEDPENPREWDGHLGTMVCWHSRYNLGDKQPKESSSTYRQDLKLNAGVILPLYLYDHSGITMSTTPFSCPWDSGQVGFIYVTGDTICEEYKCKKVTPTIRKKVTEVLKQEVKIYDRYLTGDFYAYIITSDNDIGCDDSCVGFDVEVEAIKTAKEAIDDWIEIYYSKDIGDSN